MYRVGDREEKAEGPAVDRVDLGFVRQKITTYQYRGP